MSNLSQKLDLRHSQTLVMSPQLQQAIKLLQLNNVELAEYIEGELAQNPLLEKDERDEHDAPGDPGDKETADNGRDEVQDEFDQVWTGNEAQGDTKAGASDFDPGAVQVGSGGSAGFDDAEMSFENRMSREITLREHLEEQLHMAFADPRDRLIGALLIDQVDESGYIRTDTLALAEKLGCGTERLEKLLDRMKQFDPTGICAKDLPECLALQLEERGQYDGPMKILLANLEMLADHDFAGLAKKCAVNETYLLDMIAEIRALNPRPAGDFDHFIAQTAIPDVLMKRLPKDVGGGWRVELNADTLPKVLVNNQYYNDVAQRAASKQDKKYLDEQLQAAGWLVRALDQRAKTVLKVAGEIIERQEAFFLYGVEFLRPLVLREIAEAIDMHESTVSRVTTGKYIGTPRGIFELKYFFSSSLGEGANAHSSEAVRAKIRNLIEAESPADVLSDDKIVDILHKEGIEIARRTVAKYRESLHIPSSVQRRRQKKNAARGS